MKLFIMDFESNKVPVALKDFKNVVRMRIEVLTGDEILHVIYRDYHEETYDSRWDRMMCFPDANYVIYDITEDINDIEKWSKRKDTYDYVGIGMLKSDEQ